MGSGIDDITSKLRKIRGDLEEVRKDFRFRERVRFVVSIAIGVMSAIVVSFILR